MAAANNAMNAAAKRVRRTVADAREVTVNRPRAVPGALPVMSYDESPIDATVSAEVISKGHKVTI